MLEAYNNRLPPFTLPNLLAHVVSFSRFDNAMLQEERFMPSRAHDYDRCTARSIQTNPQGLHRVLIVNSEANTPRR